MDGAVVDAGAGVVRDPGAGPGDRESAQHPTPGIEQVDYDISGLHATIADELSALGWYFDTTHLDAESTARAILTEAPRRAQVTSKHRP